MKASLRAARFVLSQVFSHKGLGSSRETGTPSPRLPPGLGRDCSISRAPVHSFGPLCILCPGTCAIPLTRGEPGLILLSPRWRRGARSLSGLRRKSGKRQKK
jgi:hypothetical protein